MGSCCTKSIIFVGLLLLEAWRGCVPEVWYTIHKMLVVRSVPTHIEIREAFVARLRSAVTWVNRNRSEYLKSLCDSQKARARDVIAASGARTAH